MATILVDEPVHPALLEEIPRTWDVLYLTDNPNEEELARVEGMLVYAHPTIDAAFLSRIPRVRVVANFGVGVPHINLTDAQSAGVPVTNTPGTLHHATADLTAGLVLAVTRNIVPGHQFATGPNFHHYDPHLFWGLELHGATLGIVGMGQVGTEVARRMRAFGMHIVYHNRRRVADKCEEELGAVYVPLDTLLESSDVVVLMTTLTNETRGMIGLRELSLMKGSAYLVNASRGAVVDHDVLVTALTEGLIKGAALDATEPEPLPRDHPLLRMENVVVTPHIGSATLETRRRMMQRAVANLEAGLRGERLPDLVV